METSFIEKFDQALNAIDTDATRAYEHHLAELITFVNHAMGTREDLGDFIGPNQVEVMYANHTSHANFLCSQFKLKSAQTVVKTIIWAYQSYTNRGFSPNYFPSTLETWKKAITTCLEPHTAEPILALYQLLLDSHRDFLVLSRLPSETPQIDESLVSFFNRYMDALLKPDTRAALHVSKEYIKTIHDIPTWWERIIWPSMYEIGRLWSEGQITVGQEHIATSITQRVMSTYYPMILDIPRNRGSVIVTVSPQELHEIGARMLADMLEMNGWDVYYTGANTPKESLAQLLEQHQARFLCISTTMSFHLEEVADIITTVRSSPLPTPAHIIVGGQAYLNDSELWRSVGADGFVVSASQTVDYLQSLNGTGMNGNHN
jgi:methanogenic corrinoid protein MtbC1